MATFAFKAVDLAGIPQTGEIDGADKQSVTSELKAQGLKVMALEEKKTGLQMELRLGPKRVKAAELTVMSRQLATMISSGMTLLRAFYVLEEQVENQMLRETVGAVREDIEAGLSFSDALERHPKVFNPLYVAMVRAGEAGGVLEESLERIADQLEKDDSLRRQVKSAMAYPTVVFSFALLVLIGDDRVHRPRVRRRVQGLRRRAAAHHPLHRRRSPTLVTGQWYILIAVAIGGFVGFRKWKTSSWGRPQWDAFRLRIPFKHRQDGAEDRARALVAHVLRALRRGRADHAGDRGDRPDRRQRGRRPGDGRRDRVGQVRRLDRRAAQGRADLPADGRADDRDRRGDRQPRHDAVEGRGLLRGRGRRRRSRRSRRSSSRS